ncbi:MAG: tyrosine-type recombinase/integrase [Planctomycetes bacterium]|nr:tyrosine-type recombinase/integrase [Planctomycetota bacterium]
MRLFKPKYKSKRGKQKEVKKYWVEVVDSRERAFRKVLRFPTSEGEGLAKKLGEKIQDLINHAAMNELNPDLIGWIEDYAPTKLQERLRGIGLLPKREAEVDKPLLDYLSEFHRAIFEESKDSPLKKTTTADTSAKTVTARVRKLIEGCGFITWRDVSKEKVNDYIESRPNGMSQQTAHFYVQAFRRFCRWMFDAEYIDRPIKIRKVDHAKNYGRCFELDEFEGLLEAARTGPERYGLTGYQRYILYLLACETGLRRGELRSLTVASVDLKNSCVFVKGGVDGATKNKGGAHQYFTAETGELLRNYIKGKMPNVQLFPIHHRSGKMVKADCEAAGIEAENHKGKLTLHSLRHSCGSYLLAHGVRPKEVQEIMRHKTFALTMDRYGHLLDGHKREAVNKLPRFAKPKAKGKSA